MPVSIRPGDAVFVRTGDPLLVKDRDKATGMTTLNRDPETVIHGTRHGYINGLEPEKREQLFAILDEVKSASVDPEERVSKLREVLGEIEQDPKNLGLARYVRAEMTHIMNSYGIKPREYLIHDSRIR